MAPLEEKERERERERERDKESERERERHTHTKKWQLSQARSIAVGAHVPGQAWVHAEVYNWS